MEGYFIAEKKIEKVVVVEGRATPSGAKFVDVTFEDKTVEQMPLTRLEMTATEAASDASGVQLQVRKRVSSMLFLTLHEYGVKMGEVNGICDAMVDLVTAGHEKAAGILFGFEQNFLPLNVVNDILLKNANTNTKEESADGSASDGSGSDTANTV